MACGISLKRFRSILMVGALASHLGSVTARADPLRELHSITSSNGVLQVDLVIKSAMVMLNGHMVHDLRTYNGDFPGPTLRAHPGDVMKIRYINRLVEDLSHSSNHTHGYNSVNLHTHGLNTSPEGYSDNVYLDIEPGQWVPYEFHIPTNHPTGLFWYHPHMHGAASTQIGSALTGNLILTGQGDLGEIPEVAAAKTVEMLFNEIPLQLISSNGPNSTEVYMVPDSPTDIFGAGTATPGVPPSLRIYTLNGAPLLEVDSRKPKPTALVPPEIKMRPGEVQRWQITHAGLEQFLALVLIDELKKPLPLYLLSFDGITLPRLQGTTNAVLLGGGNRVEFLVTAGAVGSKYILKSKSNYSQDPSASSYEIPLASVTVEGEPINMNLPVNLNPPVSRLPDITDQEIVKKRTIAFSFGSGTSTPTGTVNGVPFDPLNSAQTMILDTAEEWLLTSESTVLAVSHPFHIHVNWFQVVKINGMPVPPRWQDTVIIPFGGNVTIRHRFQQYTGRFVLHCHILVHEDIGMMAGVEVVDPKNLNDLQTWRMTNFGSFENKGRSADTAKTLGGLRNLFHYAYGFSTNATAGLPVPRKVTVDGSDYLAVKFDWRIPAAGGNPVSYALYESPDLLQWALTSSVPVGEPVDEGNGYQSLVVRDTKPISGVDPHRYFMLTLQTQPNALPITADLPE